MVERGRLSGGGFSGQVAGAVAWLAAKRSVPRDVAEEAVQEALLQLLQLADSRWPASLEGWIRRTAERRLIDMQRHLSTQVGPSPESEIADVAGDQLDLETILLVRTSLRALDPELRTVVVLRLARAKWSEIAAFTGLGEEVARKRFERALVTLQELIGDAIRA